jgi:hypothetical protein
MRWEANYGICLTIGVIPLGPFLAVPFIFSIKHRPRFVRWSDISIRKPRGWWLNYAGLCFRRASSIPLQVSEQPARWSADRSGASWPSQGQ